MEKIFAVINVARQIEGEYLFVRTEKAFKQASKADAFMAQRNQESIGTDGKSKVVRLTTPNGQADCYCTFGVFEIDLED